MPGIPFNVVISLKQPLSVPSADAPLSPMIKKMSVSSRILRSPSVSMTLPDVVVGLLQEPRVDFHLTREHRLQTRPASRPSAGISG